MDTTFVINTGSTSKKYAIYKEGRRVFSARYERKANEHTSIFQAGAKHDAAAFISESDYTYALAHAIKEALERKILESPEEVKIVGVHVAAPGTFFQAHREIDGDYIERLKRVQPYAPLHITPALGEIGAAIHTFADAIVIGVSDSAFHGTIPEFARRYSIDKDDASGLDIYKFGYHGIAVGSALKKVTELSDGTLPTRAVVCHLENGASITALQDGVSVDNSMGFSPNAGLHMTTRTGDIDPNALIYLAKKKDLSFAELRTYIHTKGGIKGASGFDDIEMLMEHVGWGEEDAAMTLGMYLYRIKEYIGAYAAILGGINVLVLSGSVNEQNEKIREMLCNDLGYLGILLDRLKNTSVAEEGSDCFLHSADASTKVALIHTDEIEELYKRTEEVVS